MTKFILGFLAGVLCCVVPPLLVAGLGLPNVAATSGPYPLEEMIAPIVRDASIRRRAPDVQNPVAGKPGASQGGMSEYFEDCVLCHALPGTSEPEFKVLYPPAPPLDQPSTQARSDGELFWIIQNGIKMTGMPSFGSAHTDEEIWEIVEFLRQLPELDAPGSE